MKISRVTRREAAARRGPRTGRRHPPALPALEWAEDMTGLSPRITAIGSHSLLVENYTCILDFSDTRVALGSRAGTLCALGSGLSLECVRSGGLIIRGDIRRVELPCKEGDPPDER